MRLKCTIEHNIGMICISEPNYRVFKTVCQVTKKFMSYMYLFLCVSRGGKCDAKNCLKVF